MYPWENNHLCGNINTRISKKKTIQNFANRTETKNKKKNKNTILNI